MSQLRVAVVYPDLLGTYGDGGNGEILAARARWRGIETQLLQASSSDALPEAEIYCLGGGEDGPQVLAAERLIADGRLSAAVADGAVVLAVCAGFQIAGLCFPDAQGTSHEGLSLLGITTTKGRGPRAVGELAADVLEASEGGLDLPRLTGFENHGGVTTLVDGTRPLARVITGVGNGGPDRSEGAVAGRVIGTYLHGPVLARNPAMADLLLALSLGVELEPLDDSREELLRVERLSRASGREGSVPRP